MRTVGAVHFDTVETGLLGVGGGDAELLDGGRDLRDGHRLRHLGAKGGRGWDGWCGVFNIETRDEDWTQEQNGNLFQ